MLLGLLLGFWVYLLSDLISYGMPFISSINYYKANMIDNIGTNWGSSPFSFYFLQYSKYLSFLLVFLFPGLVAKWKSQYPIIIGTIFFVVLHSIIEHKELRFIYFTFPVLLYYIIEGIFVFYIFLKKYKNIFALSFVCLLTITSLSVNYNNVTKKIPWNFLNEILQLFLNAEENGLSGSSLVTINENYACGAGYVYLGRKYTDQLYFFKMSKYSFDFQKRLIEKKKIKNVLIWNTESEYYCKNFKFCETIWSIGNVSWKKRSL
ncbi:hypothetical protein LPTSP4_24650 [Leptospira ryugenii]|uniref:Mannosyltransferase n=2 Tax=Leptospira ryugenii TaxID=1917863 RepID=A0A2P2E212_9LEPT|nr:hypothetical protein LPTSP4_24650 [Leptospira ryugenii]